MSADNRKWWTPLWTFAVHGAVGMALFALIAIPAVMLSLLVKWLQSRNTDKYVIYGLAGAEYFVFAIDLLLFVWFVLRTAWRTAKDL